MNFIFALDKQQHRMAPWNSFWIIGDLTHCNMRPPFRWMHAPEYTVFIWVASPFIRTFSRFVRTFGWALLFVRFLSHSAVVWKLLHLANRCILSCFIRYSSNLALGTIRMVRNQEKSKQTKGNKMVIHECHHYFNVLTTQQQQQQQMKWMVIIADRWIACIQHTFLFTRK